MTLVLTIIVCIFLILETSNVLALYFRPGTTKANAVGVFSGWEKSKEDPEVHDFVRYLVWWVAGTKLIFISLLVVILVFGDPVTQQFAVLALIISTLTFFWKLFPLIRSMERVGHLTEKNYSKTLGIMIMVIVLLLLFAYLNDIHGWIVI